VIARPKHVCPAARHAKEFFMKNLYKLLGIAALALAIVFSMTGCPTESKNDSSNNNRETLFISAEGEQVYNKDTTGKTPYTGSFTLGLSSGIGGTGEVKDGKLTFKIETPSLVSMSDLLSQLWQLSNYDDVKATNDSVQGNSISEFWDVNADWSTNFQRVVKEKWTQTGGGGTWEQITYVYVDGDVTISGTGKETPYTSETIKTNNITLPLKKGWNTLCEKHVNTGGTTTTAILSVSSPSLYWVYYDAPF
jgi:hypothetical protein